MIRPAGFRGALFGNAVDGNGRDDTEQRVRISNQLDIPSAWASIRQVHGDIVITVGESGVAGDGDVSSELQASLAVARHEASIESPASGNEASHEDGSRADEVRRGGGVPESERVAVRAPGAPAGRIVDASCLTPDPVVLVGDRSAPGGEDQLIVQAEDRTRIQSVDLLLAAHDQVLSRGGC